MMRHIHAILVGSMLTLAAAWAQPPDTVWTQTYGGIGEDGCFTMQQTADLGYLLGGNTFTFGMGDEDMYLVKADSLGVFQWQQTHGGVQDDACMALQLTADGGFILAGYTESFTSIARDLYLVKTDSLGNMVWQAIIGGEQEEEGYAVQQTADGGFVAAGHTQSYGAGDFDAYLVKTDAQGNVVWQATYGGLLGDYARSVALTSEGGYVLGGWAESFGSSDDFYLVVTDSGGNLVWQNHYGGPGQDIGYCVRQTADGGFILGGGSESFSLDQDRDFYVVKTDASGNEQWESIIGTTSDDECLALALTGDGGYILGGYSGIGGFGSTDFYVVKLDSGGNFQWHQVFGGSGIEEGRAIVQTADSGYALAGMTDSFGAGSFDFYAIKLEPGGSPSQITVELEPDSLPIVIPQSGGSFNYSISITNPHDTYQYIHAWIMVTLPNGSPYGPLVGPVYMTIPANFTLSRERMQSVPPNAPPGIYSFQAFVGVYPDIVWDSDSFPFEKLAAGGWGPGAGDWANTGGAFQLENAAPFILYPSSFSLTVSPNPFNAATTLRFDLPQAGWVRLEVFDMNGRVVGARHASPAVGFGESGLQGWYSAGTHEVTFDGSDLPSGVYLYRLQAGELSAAGKMVLLK